MVTSILQDQQYVYNVFGIKSHGRESVVDE